MALLLSMHGTMTSAVITIRSDIACYYNNNYLLEKCIGLWGEPEQVIVFINPWCMHEGYGSRSVCVCLLPS